MVRLGEVNPSVWDEVVEYMEFKLQDSKIPFSAEEDLAFDWRKSAKDRKLDREIFEQYGYFKDIILHPKFKYYKEWYDNHVKWDFILDDGHSRVPISVLVIVLSILYSRVSKDAFALIAAFLLNINPIYVVLSMLIYWFMFSKGLKPKKYRKRALHSNVPQFPIDFAMDSPFKNTVVNDSSAITYDHILLGNDISTLYTAALLARTGHKCLVIEPIGAPRNEIAIDNLSPIPLYPLVTGRAEVYQKYFDLVQSNKEKDLRVQFNPLGSAKDGYTHTIVRVILPPQATTFSQKPLRGRLAEILSFRMQEGNVASAISSVAGKFNKADFKLFYDKLSILPNSLYSYLITKVLGGKKNAQVDLITKSQGLVDFNDLVIHNIDDFEDCMAYGAMNALSVIGSQEDISAKDASGLGLAMFLANSEKGLSYPSGGLTGMRKALIHSIHSNGGHVLSNILVQGITFDNNSDKVRASGVQTVIDGRSLVFNANQSVISGLGALSTFTRLIPHEYIPSTTRESLISLSESRPKIHVVYVIDTTRSEISLNLKSSVYYEVCADDASMKWRIEKETGRHYSPEKKKEANDSSAAPFIGKYCRISCPSMQDPLWNVSHPNIQVLVVEFELLEPVVVWKPYRFAPSPESAANTELNGGAIPLGSLNGPKIFTTGSDRSQSYLDFTSYYQILERSLSEDVVLTERQNTQLLTVSNEKLCDLYPQLFKSHCISKRVIVPPVLGGFNLSSTPAKYGSKISAATDIEGLYLCGKDIGSFGIMGDIQGAWAAANAVLGYSANELIMGRSITEDLENIPVKF